MGDGGSAINASLNGTYSVALDGKGNFYITDGYHNRIRKVDAAGIITTIAGTGVQGYNGDSISATTAQIYRPVGIICDHSGNLYFADAYNNRVRKIDTAGIITTVAGNGGSAYNGDSIMATSAAVYDPHYMTFDRNGNLYITDLGNHRIRKVNTSGIITTIAGTGVAGYTGDNGPADIAEINDPSGIALDDTGNIYFADYLENVVRKIDTAGIITTFAGGGTIGHIGDGGPADSAVLGAPAGLTIDTNGNIYIAEIDGERIRKVTMASGIITTVAGDGTFGFSGDDGAATNAELSNPTGVVVDNNGNMYIADFSNDRIRYVTAALRVVQLNNAIESLSVYPNPSYSIFMLTVNSNIQEQLQIIIVNIMGEKIKQLTASTNESITIKLDQPSGIYYLSAITSHSVASKIINVVK